MTKTFLKTVVDDISDDIAKDSIYAYLEKDLNLNISYSSKSITFEPFSSIEYKIFETNLRRIQLLLEVMFILKTRHVSSTIFRSILRLILSLKSFLEDDKK